MTALHLGQGHAWSLLTDLGIMAGGSGNGAGAWGMRSEGGTPDLPCVGIFRQV